MENLTHALFIALLASFAADRTESEDAIGDKRAF